jgi:hypothetical protein
MDIAIDFDGTCVTHEYPLIGRDIGAAPVLKELVSKGHRLILFTMRSDRKLTTLWGKTDEPYLTDAISWFNEREIELFGVQIHPEQEIWTDSPKAYAQLYIDDAALGCPLIQPPNPEERPYADWVKIRDWLLRNGML